MPPPPPPPPPPPVPELRHDPLLHDADQLQVPEVSEHVPVAPLEVREPLQAPNEMELLVTDPEFVSPLGEQVTVMLQPLWEMEHDVSEQFPEMLHSPATFGQLPLLPPELPPELQPKTATITTEAAIKVRTRMASSSFEST